MINKQKRYCRKWLAPNIVNVATITGITTYHAGIATVGASAGVTTVVINAASSGKVLKINALTAAAIGATTGVTLKTTIKQEDTLQQQAQYQWEQPFQFLQTLH